MKRSQQCKIFIIFILCFFSSKSIFCQTEALFNPFLPRAQTWFIINLGTFKTKEFSSIQKNYSVTFDSFSGDIRSLDFDSLSATSNLELIPAIIGKPLNYPNPFKLSAGTEIGYFLNSDIDLQIRIYTIFGQLITSVDCKSSQEGGSLGYNKIPINASVFHFTVPASVYVYVIAANGKLLGKGKMAVIP